MTFCIEPTGINVLVYKVITPAQVWTITHNFGTQAVNVQTLIQYGNYIQEIIPYQVLYPDANTVEIHWTKPFAGQARITS